MRILLVDDDPDALILGQFALQRRPGWTVDTCARAEEVVQHIQDERPQVVLLDFMLGDVDGFQVLETIRSQLAGAGALTSPDVTLPVIFLSGKGAELTERALAAGALGVIAKPFDPATLADAVERLLVDNL